jgi:putative transposase
LTPGRQTLTTRHWPATAKRREELKLIITKASEDSDGTYGYRRVHAPLQRWGVPCGDGLARAGR